MKKGISIIIFIAFFVGFCHAKVVRLGVINPTPRNLEKVLYLINNNYIDLDNVEVIGIYHESQKELIESTRQFISKNDYSNISLSTIKSPFSLDSLFVNNKCTGKFEELFLRTDGLIFLGGADISPQLYGERTFLSTELIPVERNWEISFLFHLIGGSQNNNLVPLLEQKPDYLILGICLGMQEMNVAAGGTLYQDIPFQIYQKTDYESVLEQDTEVQHKNYQNRINYLGNTESVLHFHHIKISPSSLLDFGQKENPLVTSVHHQSVKEPGQYFEVIATSIDGKVIEAIWNSKYRNVYGVQFHPEFSVLYEQQEFKNSLNETVRLNNNSMLFHKDFWKDFSERLKTSHE